MPVHEAILHIYKAYNKDRLINGECLIIPFIRIRNFSRKLLLCNTLAINLRRLSTSCMAKIRSVAFLYKTKGCIFLATTSFINGSKHGSVYSAFKITLVKDGDIMNENVSNKTIWDCQDALEISMSNRKTQF